ncbi:MAG: NUDIX hydrolase [Trueperaceae bacterium]|nr:NUDIX hydrolase [Trueperaceae bacterium]
MDAKQVIYQGKILNLIKLDNRWEIVEHQPAVCVLVIRGEQVLGVRQRRPAIGGETWELPAGLVEPGEEPAEAAVRELAEETQHRATLTLLAQIYSSPGFSTEKVYIYEATDLSPAPDAVPDEGEDLSVEWRPLKETYEAIRCGEIASSAHTLLALTYALGRRGAL